MPAVAMFATSPYLCCCFRHADSARRQLVRTPSAGTHLPPLADFADGMRMLGRRASDVIALNAAFAAQPTNQPQVSLQRPSRLPARLWAILTPDQRQLLSCGGTTMRLWTAVPSTNTNTHACSPGGTHAFQLHQRNSLRACT